MGLIRRGATALALLALAAGELLAQRRVSGKVTEEGSGAPLSNVSVQRTSSNMSSTGTETPRRPLTIWPSTQAKP